MSNLNELAKHGFFVEPNSVEKIENIKPDKFKELLDYVEKENIVVISKDIIDKFTGNGIKLLKTFTILTKYSVNDYVKILNETYSTLKDILFKKIDTKNLVSINKCGTGKTSIIGMVKEKEKQAENFLITFEDPTGEVKCITPKDLGEKLSIDDVVAVSGNINNKIFFVEKVVFPDVPLRQPNYSQHEIKVVFTEKKCDADYIIRRKKLYDKVKNKNIEISYPALFSINNVTILVALGVEPLDVLRRRYININNSHFIIEPVPDIFFTDKNINFNYKGITIVSEDNIIDLKTRNIFSLK